MSDGIYLGNFIDGPNSKPSKAKGPVHDIEPKGLVTIGPPGCGKGMSILVPNLCKLNRSIFVIDPKGELAAITARHRKRFGEVIILNPFGVLATDVVKNTPRPNLKFDFLKSRGFNPLLALNPDSNLFVDKVSNIAEGLIRIEEKQPYFSEGARALVAATIMYLRRMVGDDANLALMRQMICSPPSEFGKFVDDMINCDFPSIVNKVSRFKSTRDDIQAIVSSAISQTDFLDSDPIAKDLVRGSLDFSEMKRRTMTVYVILPADMLATHGGWLRLVVASALNSLMSPPVVGRSPVLFMLDEFAQLGHMAVVENAMAIVRGYGIQIWPILQDLTQLQGIYGDRWETFLGTAGVVTAFTPNDLTTANYLSERSGDREVFVEQYSTLNKPFTFGGGTKSTSSQSAPLYRTDDFLSMERQRMVCLKQGMQPFFTHTPIYKDVSGCSHLPLSPYFAGSKGHDKQDDLASWIFFIAWIGLGYEFLTTPSLQRLLATDISWAIGEFILISSAIFSALFILLSEQHRIKEGIRDKRVAFLYFLVAIAGILYCTYDYYQRDDQHANTPAQPTISASQQTQSPSPAPAQPKYGYVNVPSLDIVRGGTIRVIGHLSMNDRVEIFETVNGWLRIKSANGIEGYVPPQNIRLSYN